MVAFDLFEHTPFPEEGLKNFVMTGAGNKLHAVSWIICNAEANSWGMPPRAQCHIKMDINRLGEFCVFYRSHASCGRARFQSDMDSLKNLLVDAGGFKIHELWVFFSSCCDDLFPDAINMFYNASAKGGDAACNLFLSERDGAADPAVATAIVESWRIGKTADSGSFCRLSYAPDTSPHHQVFEAIFTKPNLEHIEIAPVIGNWDPMSNAALGIVTSLLSSPQSGVRTLSLRTVTANADADRLLASMLETNKSLKALYVTFNLDNWVATEMVRAMREANCTLTNIISLDPTPREEGSLTYMCQEELTLYAILNELGRGCMRSTTFQPQKIPTLLRGAARAESYGPVGRFLYPMLRENPSAWTGYL